MEDLEEVVRFFATPFFVDTSLRGGVEFGE